MISDTELVERAVRNAKPRKAGLHPYWVAIKETFGTGSTVSHEICKRHGIDSDSMIWGIDQYDYEEFE